MMNTAVALAPTPATISPVKPITLQATHFLLSELF